MNAPYPTAICVLIVLVGSTGPAFAADDRIVPLCFDSGTRVVCEVAEALSGEGRSILECYPPGSRAFLWFLSLFPERTRIAGIEWGMSLSLGAPRRELAGFEISSLPEWCVSQYGPGAEKYDAIVIGSPNGAVAHLSALLRAPFLTSSFGLAIRHRPIDPDDIGSYAAIGSELAEEILKKPGGSSIEVIDHYDPIHDRPLVRYANFLRVKLLDLPDSYRSFIRDNLAAGGRLILIDCSYPWPEYRVAERSYLQVGGLGAISPEEYLERYNLDLPLEERRESEWGSPEGFASSVRSFAEENGIDLLEIGYDRPEDYSLLTYRAYLACPGAREEDLMIDSFNYQNPRTNIETGIPALWLPFDTEDTLAFAEEFLRGKTFSRIYLTLVPSFAGSEDTASIEDWMELLSSHGEVFLLGIDPDAFPADTLAPFDFVRDMNRLREERRLPVPLFLDVDDLIRILSCEE